MLLRACGEGILSLASDLELGDEVFGVPAGVLTREGIVQTVGQHACRESGPAPHDSPSVRHPLGRSQR